MSLGQGVHQLLSTQSSTKDALFNLEDLQAASSPESLYINPLVQS